ncbi:hypothetical protein, partial [Bacillus paranthracis]|uniref:hypothetical protein n=1 Tax=Bacillus paranthracis TaxID=2026186 RepID=UPI0039A0540F
MSKQDVIRFIGSLFLAELILNASLIMLSISWRTIFISNVALVILYGIAEYREQKRLKEEGIPSIDERVVNKMKSYFTIRGCCKTKINMQCYESEKLAEHATDS